MVVRAGPRTILSIDRLEIERGERLALIGASGCGKTTLLRLIKGYPTPPGLEVTGRIEVLGRVLPVADRAEARRHQRDIGMIHQHFDLIGRESLWRNVIHGRLGFVPLWRSVLGVYPGRDLGICLEAIEEVHMEDKLERAARTLSGGEQQRVAIARALAQEPEVLLADEPVSSLDPGLAVSVMDVLLEVCETHGLTLLTSLHLPDLARRYARRVVALGGGSVLLDVAAADLSDESLATIYPRLLKGGSAPLNPPKNGGSATQGGFATRGGLRPPWTSRRAEDGLRPLGPLSSNNGHAKVEHPAHLSDCDPDRVAGPP